MKYLTTTTGQGQIGGTGNTRVAFSTGTGAMGMRIARRIDRSWVLAE